MFTVYRLSVCLASGGRCRVGTATSGTTSCWTASRFTAGTASATPSVTAGSSTRARLGTRARRTITTFKVGQGRNAKFRAVRLINSRTGNWTDAVFYLLFTAPCSENGICNAQTGACDCHTGWAGFRCLTPCEPCDHGTCQYDGTCLCDGTRRLVSYF